MKKIALISLFSLALFGCGEKEVTKEMLVGDWECSSIEQKAKWENGLFQDYEPPVDLNSLVVKYIKEEDELFVKLPDIDKKIPEDFERMNRSYENYLGDVVIIGVNKLEYISDNEFKSISEYTITQDKSEDNVKAKVIQSCTRIK